MSKKKKQKKNFPAEKNSKKEAENNQRPFFKGELPVKFSLLAFLVLFFVGFLIYSNSFDCELTVVYIRGNP